jgi:hypothetical protein
MAQAGLFEAPFMAWGTCRTAMNAFRAITVLGHTLGIKSRATIDLALLLVTPTDAHRQFGKPTMIAKSLLVSNTCTANRGFAG